MLDLEPSDIELAAIEAEQGLPPLDRACGTQGGAEPTSTAAQESSDVAVLDSAQDVARPAPAVLSLDDLLAPLLKQGDDRRELARLRKERALGRPKTGAGANIAALSMKIEWRDHALVMLVAETMCSCGGFHSISEGIMLERLPLPGTDAARRKSRWLVTAPAGWPEIKLPRRTERRSSFVNECPSCAHEHGFKA